jgi:putative hydrolase of the HAD superfamily
MQRAVTFDFWDTIVIDDSDEPKRASKGLTSKAVARRTLFVNELLSHHQEIGRERADSAFDYCNDLFRHWWKVEHHTPHIHARLLEGFRHLDLAPTPGFEEMVAQYAALEVDTPPELAPGIHECLEDLSSRYRLGIISDAIVTPGIGLRQILKNYELLYYFDYCVFSDEAGAAKPAPKVFDIACEQLRVRPANLVHIGDREANDVAGPVDYGAKCVLYTGVIDRGSSENTAANAVCIHHNELPATIDALFPETD